MALSSLGLSPLTCGTQTDNYVAQFDGDPNELLTMTQAASVPVAFAWADPPNQNSSKFDVIWVNTDTNAQGCLSASTATDNLISQTVTFNGATFKLYVATPDASCGGEVLQAVDRRRRAHLLVQIHNRERRDAASVCDRRSHSRCRQRFRCRG